MQIFSLKRSSHLLHSFIAIQYVCMYVRILHTRTLVDIKGEHYINSCMASASL